MAKPGARATGGPRPPPPALGAQAPGGAPALLVVRQPLCSKPPKSCGPEPCLIFPFIAYPASARGAAAGSRLAKPPEGLDLDPVGEPRDHRKARKGAVSQDHFGVAKSPLDFLAFSWKVLAGAPEAFSEQFPMHPSVVHPGG